VRATRDSEVLCISPAALKWIGCNKAARKLINLQYQQNAIEEVCEDLGLLAEIPLEVLRKLAATSQKMQKIPTGGQLLLNQGDLADSLYVIRSGFVEAFYKRDDNTVRMVSYLREGDSYGRDIT
jgi:hypothetical protein